MKNSVNQLDVLLNAIDAITTEKTSLLTELSLCDCYLSDIYHLLENIDFPASEYSYLMRELKDTLRERRHIKNDIKRIQMIEDSFTKSKIEGIYQSLREKSHRIKRPVEQYKYTTKTEKGDLLYKKYEDYIKRQNFQTSFFCGVSQNE